MLLPQPSYRSNYGISAVGSGISNARRMPSSAGECGQLLGYADSSRQHLGCSAGDRTAGCAVRLPVNVNDRNSEKRRQRSLPRPHRSERRGAGSDYTVRFTWMAPRSFTRRPRRSIHTSGCRTDDIPWKWLRVAGYIATSSIQLNVVAQDVGATDIQNRTNWVSCSALISGSTCAARVGVAQSSLALHQSTPSLDRSASRFSPGGKQAYSNDLYWTPLGGGNSVSHFSYDLWFHIDNGNAPQSLAFDVNQVFGGTRWTWGTQCDFTQTHKWDIWDPLHGVWMPTSVPCNHFPSNPRIHLVWKLERVGDQVHSPQRQCGRSDLYGGCVLHCAAELVPGRDRRRFPDGGQRQTGAV
jgi:hypothetical protein